MKNNVLRMVFILLLMGAVHHPAVHAGGTRNREAESRIFWHYPQSRLRVGCDLPPGTVISSVSLPLPAGVMPGISRLSHGDDASDTWTLLGTSVPGLSVRAVLDSNGLLTADGSAPKTVLRLELLQDGVVHDGWLTVPEQHLWWNVYDPDTRAPLWRGRIVWTGKMKIETGSEDGDTNGQTAGDTPCA